MKKIISGGQTGVDRAALDVALELGIPCGGVCPKGRMAEDGRIPDCYPLYETLKPGYLERTRINVGASDATLIITDGPLSRGSRRTLGFCLDLRKPFALFYLDMDGEKRISYVRRWLAEHEVVNVAGPRESKCPGIHDRAADLLRKLLENSDS